MKDIVIEMQQVDFHMHSHATQEAKPKMPASANQCRENHREKMTAHVKRPEDAATGFNHHIPTPVNT
jgi:hypothetical protein